jgi:exosome complex RNA-binding protein Csl4
MTTSKQLGVLCPNCRQPMMASKPFPVTTDVSEIAYKCEACRATTTRKVKS